MIIFPPGLLVLLTSEQHLGLLRFALRSLWLAFAPKFSYPAVDEDTPDPPSAYLSWLPYGEYRLNECFPLVS